MLSGLARANEGDEVDRLRRQVKYLSDALVSARAEADALKAQRDSQAVMAAGGAEAIPAAGVLKEKEYRVLSVNKELGMVILDGGRQDGLKPGLLFTIIDGDRAVSTVRVVDVRTAVSGAVIQETGRGFPGVRDRAVPVTGSRN